MKDLLLKGSGTLLIGFLAVIFTGCKDQRNKNDDYRETYPPAGDTERTGETYDNNDTLYPNDGMDNTQQNNQSGNNQSGNRQSGSVPDDGTGVNPTTPDNTPTGN